MKAMALAAGFGTRLMPYTLIRPKPLFPILATPLLTIILEQLRRAGCARIVVNAHHLAGQIEMALAGESDVIVQTERAILGTGGALRLALEHFDAGAVLVVNGDIFHSIDLAAVCRFHNESGARVTMVLHDFPGLNNVTVGRHGRVTGFARFGPLPESDRLFAYTGVQVVDPGMLKGIPEGGYFDIIEFYTSLIASGNPIMAYTSRDHYWADIGTPEEYLALHRRLLTEKPRPMDLPVPPERPFLVSPKAVIGTGSRFFDWVCIGPKAVVGRDVTLRRTVVWDGAVIQDGADISDAIVT